MARLLWLLGLVIIALFGMYQLTGEPIWRQRAMAVVRGAVVVLMLVVGWFVLRRAAVFI